MGVGRRDPLSLSRRVQGDFARASTSMALSLMARRSLKPQLNQIRTWVRQGRTDAWIAHQLEATVQQISTFKQENELISDDEAATNGAPAADDLDLRAEDDALIAAELEAEAARRAEEDAEAARIAAEEAANAPDEDEDPSGSSSPNGELETESASADSAKPRRRGRRGGRGRSRRGSGPSVVEGTFDHGDEGYGLWLDPSVADSPIYAEHWSGNRDVTVTVQADQIIIRRAGEPAGDDAS